MHALGGDAWERAKRKAAQKVRDVAAELLALYAQREARQGHSFSYDRNLYEQFAASFPFEETPDQLRAIEAVIADLASGKAMDRVVCGDVGFGKTEVALRGSGALSPRLRASRSPCSRRPPCWRNSTTRISATVMPTGPCASK